MTKSKYKIRVTETLEREVEIEANTEDIAVTIAEERYKKEEIVLDSGDFDTVDFNIVNDDDDNMCQRCAIELKHKMIDVDGTNLEEHKICESCGYGMPALT